MVAGRYTLERCINRGGIGSLWLARDEQSDSYCGLRLAESTGQGIVELAARYLAEVDVVGRIRCENVVDVLDYGEWNGLPFLAVEHVEGDELSAVLLRNGSMQPKVAYRIVAQTARALARAHAAGIVHGDLTPENILITSDGMQPMAKVFNFGLSQRGAEVGMTNATRIGSFLRMPYYSSPEQVANRAVDWRSDLWSLAVICYECLTGRRPFDSNNFAELMALISGEPVAPIVLPGGRTPAALQSWWEKAISRDPAKRFQSAKELADALGKCFGFPLVFVPEPTSATLGPQASPAALPIVLRDSSAPPPPGPRVRSSGRALTPNPKLKSGPPMASHRPTQVAVRSRSPMPDLSTPLAGDSRHATAIGLGISIPPDPSQSRPSAAPRGSSAPPDDAELAPPSSLKVDVDVEPASARAPEGAPGSLAASDASVPDGDEEEFYEGFPLSEAPTVARRPPEPARRVVLKGTSSDPFIQPSAPPPVRHRAAWVTAAAIVIAGTITAARLVSNENRVPASAAGSPSRDLVNGGLAASLATARLVDAGLGTPAEVDPDDDAPVSGSQLEAKLAEEIARVAAAAADAAAQAPEGRTEQSKPKPVRAPARAPRPTKPGATPNVGAPAPTTPAPPDGAAKKPADGAAKKPADGAAKKPADGKPSIEREYGI